MWQESLEAKSGLEERKQGILNYLHDNHLCRLLATKAIQE